MTLKKSAPTSQVWMSLQTLFHDNKDAKEIKLYNELWNITIGESSTCIKNIADLLGNIDKIILEKKLVMYTINGLSPEFHNLASLIRRISPFPMFLKMRSMLLLEEQQINQLQHRSF